MPRLVFADHFLIEALPFVAPVFLVCAVLLVMFVRDRRDQSRSTSDSRPSSTRSSPNA